MAKTDDKNISVVASCLIRSARGDERVKSFDKAWHRMRELGREYSPVVCAFEGFVRKD